MVLPDLPGLDPALVVGRQQPPVTIVAASRHSGKKSALKAQPLKMPPQHLFTH
jgi:hypothetical protein